IHNDNRRARRGRKLASVAGRLRRTRWISMGVLHIGPDLLGNRDVGRESRRHAELCDGRSQPSACKAQRHGDSREDERQHLPLRGLSEHRGGDQASCRTGIMKAFTYERAASTVEAATAVVKPGARIIAGGTNLLDLMKLQVETPLALIDIS